MRKDDKEVINNVFDLDYNKFLDFIRKEAGFDSGTYIIYRVFDND
jgi:hypothetical protein